jgi:hypothetical protein
MGYGLLMGTSGYETREGYLPNLTNKISIYEEKYIRVLSTGLKIKLNIFHFPFFIIYLPFLFLLPSFHCKTMTQSERGCVTGDAQSPVTAQPCDII